MLHSSPLDGFWEEGYHYYLEIKGKKAVLRDYAKRVIFQTSLEYDKKALLRGERTPLALGETVLSRTAKGDPMMWIEELFYENGQIFLREYYTIMGEKNYTLKKADGGPFDDILIRDKEILPRLQGLWLEWSKNGVDKDECGIRIRGDLMTYGTKNCAMFSSRIHAVSHKTSPDQVFLTPQDLTVREFPGMTQITVKEDMLTSYQIICDVSTPLSVFLRREDYDAAKIPVDALREARNLMLPDEEMK